MDNDNAPMSEPLSEAERLAEIQARFKNRVTGHWHAVSIEFRGQTSHSVKSNVGSVLAHTGYGPVGGSSHANAEFMANAPADIEFLLNLVGVLEGQLATAQKQLDAQRQYGEQLQMSIEGCSGNHEDIQLDEEPEPLDLGHEFLPVNGHPDDDECTHRADGTDLTYCGEPKSAHSRALGLDGGGSEAKTRTTAPDTAMDEFEAADDLSRRWE